MFSVSWCPTAHAEDRPFDLNVHYYKYNCVSIFICNFSSHLVMVTVVTSGNGSNHWLR